MEFLQFYLQPKTGDNPRSGASLTYFTYVNRLALPDIWMKTNQSAVFYFTGHRHLVRGQHPVSVVIHTMPERFFLTSSYR